MWHRTQACLTSTYKRFVGVDRKEVWTQVGGCGDRGTMTPQCVRGTHTECIPKRGRDKGQVGTWEGGWKNGEDLKMTTKG